MKTYTNMQTCPLFFLFLINEDRILLGGNNGGKGEGVMGGPLERKEVTSDFE